MIKSMTGFGRGEGRDQERQFVVEIKSVNHRYNDMIVRMPKRLNYLEEKIRSLIKQGIQRGRVEVYITLESIGESDTQISLNLSLAQQYMESLEKMKEHFHIKDDVSLFLLSKFPDIFKIEEKEEDEDQIWHCLKEAVQRALDMLIKMRIIEGEKLAEDIKNKCQYIAEIVGDIEQRAPEVVLEYKEKLRNRIHELLDDTIKIDEDRLAMEVAIFADKSSIDEEIVRLKSHIEQLREALEEKDPTGRKLDFLIQEMNREINTIGSKANDLEITKKVVDIKGELEKIREQVQNIE